MRHRGRPPAGIPKNDGYLLPKRSADPATRRYKQIDNTADRVDGAVRSMHRRRPIA